jgi:hypothetical protein
MLEDQKTLVRNPPGNKAFSEIIATLLLTMDSKFLKPWRREAVDIASS